MGDKARKGTAVRGTGDLNGKVAVVVGGGGSGIGSASALALAEAGAAVLVADIDANGAKAVARAIGRSGGEASAMAADVTREESVEAMFAAATDRYGGVDVAFTSVHGGGGWDGSVAEMDLDVWNDILAVTLTGTMLVCKHAVSAMLRRGGGSIITTSSNSALAGDLTLVAYAAAKAGVNILTLSVATAFGKNNIRSNVISPASIAGPGYANVPEDVIADMRENTCLLPDLGTPQDVAKVVRFLASDQSSFVTGQVIRVDGGGLSHLPHVGYLRRAKTSTIRQQGSPAPRPEGLDAVVPRRTRGAGHVP
jgi:NAD(P)-dependent dehydrogenase (short-subunit alcohol dehydrogenase family)